jgi:deoxycytidylate deaminase
MSIAPIRPFQAMQAAVDIVEKSDHPSNKISATLFGPGWELSRTNYWPTKIVEHFGKDIRIGNSSGTVHAETACILQAGAPTEGASLCITDPFCPNCAKNIAEAGIKTIYIDHKGFDKDFFKRRGNHFDDLSMRICEKAGISVFELWRKDERMEAIFEAPDNYIPADDSPIYKEPIESPNEGVFNHTITQAFKIHERRKFAIAFVKDRKGNYQALTARGHASIGFTMEDPDDINTIEKVDSKYSLFIEPVNRLMMYMARHGMTLCNDYFFSSQVPTSREQVNLVGAGIKRITIGDMKKSRDPDGLVAMSQLSSKGIIDYT